MIRFVTGIGRRHPILTLVVWLLIAVAGFTIGNGVFARVTTTVGTVEGSQSQRGADQLADAKLSPPVLTAVLSGLSADDAALRTQVQAAIADIRAIAGVAGATDPYTDPTAIAPDNQALLIDVEISKGGEATANKVAARLHQVSGVTVAVSGGPLTDSEFDRQANSDTRRAELISAPVLLILLLLVFASLLAAGLPLLIALVGVGGTFAALFAFSFFTDVSIYAIQVTTMLAIGLAVDYSLLLVSRYREERHANADPAQALERAAERAGRTVLFSGLTVSVSLAGLLVFRDPFLRSVGLAGAAVVLIDMLAALTLLPALLALFGHRMRLGKPKTDGGRAFAAIGRTVQRVPAVALLLTLAGLAVLMLPLGHLRLDTSNPKSLPASSGTRQLTEAIHAHFPALSGPNPIQVVVTGSPDSSELTSYSAQIDAVAGIAAVRPGRAGNGVTVLLAIPENPTSSGQTAQAVRDIRALPAPYPTSVTGDAARLVDYHDELTDRLPLAAAIVVGATFVLLLLFTGSILIPIKAVLTNLLSLGAAFGVVVWAFQDGHLSGLFGTGQLDGIDLTVPVVVAAIAFGLSTDYEVFVLSRIRERWVAGDAPKPAVIAGLRRSGGIITAAALLLVVAFGGFLAGGFAPIKEVGLGLVLAVAIDATVVRLLLVPAVFALLGRAAWAGPKLLRSTRRAVPAGTVPVPSQPAEPVPTGSLRG